MENSFPEPFIPYLWNGENNISFTTLKKARWFLKYSFYKIFKSRNILCPDYLSFIKIFFEVLSLEYEENRLFFYCHDTQSIAFLKKKSHNFSCFEHFKWLLNILPMKRLHWDSLEIFQVCYCSLYSLFLSSIDANICCEQKTKMLLTGSPPCYAEHMKNKQVAFSNISFFEIMFHIYSTWVVGIIKVSYSQYQQ